MSHKEFMRRFRETISRMHNRALLDHYDDSIFIEEVAAAKMIRDEEVQAIIDILSHPHILSHRSNTVRLSDAV